MERIRTQGSEAVKGYKGAGCIYYGYWRKAQSDVTCEHLTRSEGDIALVEGLL
jgi:hypothetical protein